MSETVARQRPSVDLDDFERSLQAHQQYSRQHAHEDDPLAELARIVGEQPDPYGDVFAQQPVASAQHAELRPSYQPHGRREPSFGAASPDASSLETPMPRFSADFAAIEAGLRGGTAGGVHAPTPVETDHGYEPDAAYGAPAQDWAQPSAAHAPRGTSRRPVYVMAASIAVAVVGIGVAFAYKGSGSSPREIKTIMAAAGPTKVQPPADQTATADQDVGAVQQASTKLVSREEQPVDLAQAVQDNAAARSGPDASNVPVPPSPSQAAGTASPDYSEQGGPAPDSATASASPAYTNEQSGFGVGMPKPKRVKSVSVTPDGRIVNDAGTPDQIASIIAPTAPATKSSDRALPVAGSPLFPAPTPKSSNRATKTAPPHRAAETQPADDGDEAAAAPAPKPGKAAKKTKPVKVATAETGANDATQSASTDDAKPEGSGGFAVQLAAPGSETDARSMTTSLLKKYGGALHGRRLGYHRAESNGHTVYRVRVSSLTKDDATSLCSKLKAGGGSCFVAKN